MLDRNPQKKVYFHQADVECRSQSSVKEEKNILWSNFMMYFY